MNKSWHLPRRTFLRGLGTMIALPALEAMQPAKALAALTKGAASSAPRRMAFVYSPNGMNMADWWPESIGNDYKLSPILEPLQAHKNDFQVLSGLAHTKGRANGDGPGDHARANATFLTGCQARKTAGADIKLGVSVDQIAAQQIGSRTRLPSLELSCDRGRSAGSCDSGYSCAYQFNFAWKTETQPLAPEVDPKQVFERLFAGGKKSDLDQGRILRERYQKSLLDFALEDAKRLKANLGATDQRKLDEYLTAIRELEQRIENAEKFAMAIPATTRPKELPKGYDYEQHIRLMYDLMVMAFQTDSTRVATFLVAHDGSNRPYPKIGVTEGHHDLSHHGNDEVKKAKMAKINRFHTTQFAYFLDQLKAVKEGDGTLLDNSMIVFGSGLADPNRHAHHDLPILLAGRGGGTLKPGRHVDFPQETPMSNLYLSMLDRMGVTASQVGDSTGKLEQIGEDFALTGPRRFAEAQQAGPYRKK